MFSKLYFSKCTTLTHKFCEFTYYVLPNNLDFIAIGSNAAAELFNSKTQKMTRLSSSSPCFAPSSPSPSDPALFSSQQRARWWRGRVARDQRGQMEKRDSAGKPPML